MVSPLAGIKVVDASQVIAAPLCARHLADFGADVIHIENTKGGDFWRSYLNDVKGVTAVPSEINYNLEIFNRNKKSVALDLSQARGQEILYKLVASADVFVTNLRVYERDKFNCSYQKLKAINPKIIYASITGFGQKGDECDAPAFDQTAYWNRAGVNKATLPAGVIDTGYRAGLGDTIAGLGLYGAIMTALFHRQKTGVGQEVEVSLLSAGLYQLSFDISGALVTGQDFLDLNADSPENPDPVANEKSKLVNNVREAYDKLWEHTKSNLPNPLYGAYPTRDGRIVHLNVLQPDRYWAKVCNALGIENLIDDPRFSRHEIRTKHHKELFYIVKQAFARFALADIYRRLLQWGVPFAVQQRIKDVVHDPQARANNYFVKFEHPVHGQMEILANLMSLSETPAVYRLPAPDFSQHTEETLLELGYSWEEIAQLKDGGVIP